MRNSELIRKTIAFVKNELAAAEGGHDWFHIERVYKNALLLSKNEMVDEFIVSLAALLHDIADAKFHNGDESIGPKKATEFLFKMNVDEVIIHRVTAIISEMSFKNSIGGKAQERSIEFQVVQDADRLDACFSGDLAPASREICERSWNVLQLCNINDVLVMFGSPPLEETQFYIDCDAQYTADPAATIAQVECVEMSYAQDPSCLSAAFNCGFC